MPLIEENTVAEVRTTKSYRKKDYFLLVLSKEWSKGKKKIVCRQIFRPAQSYFKIG